MLYKLPAPTESSVELLYFRNVSNAKDILHATLRGELAGSFLQAQLIPDVFPLLLSSEKAIREDKEGSMSTRIIFTEIIYNLSGSRNIRKALKTFGIRDDTTCIIVVVPNPENIQISKIREFVKGEELPCTQEVIQRVCDNDSLRKIYGITKEESEVGTIVDSIVTRMACRDIK